MNEEPPSKQKLYPLKSRSITLSMSGDNLPIENFSFIINGLEFVA
jgi:hypothetical protein